MRNIAWIACVLLLGAAPFDPHPLNESQSIRLETADDGEPTVDEAAFYALLENAADWSQTESGASVPDYEAIRRDTNGWRGTRCLVEGTIYRVLKVPLETKGWEKVEAVVIRINHSNQAPIAQDFVVVYLTDPPIWNWRIEKKGVPWQTPVRLVARFYKSTSFDTEGSNDARSEPREYLTFVGHEARVLTPTALGPIDWRAPAMLVLLAAAIGMLVWRTKSLRRNRSGRAELQAYIDRKEAIRAGRQELDDDAGELPENPTDALGSLAEKHTEKND